jgi:hypothetical protein
MPSSDPSAGERWPTHGPNCICYGCRRRRRRLEKEALVERRRLVDSDPVAEHIEALVAAGWRIEIARAASVSPALITKMSTPGNEPNKSTAERILALG